MSSNLPALRVVRPLVSPTEATAAWDEYKALVRALLSTQDYQTFKDDDGRTKKFIKKSGWRALATFYGFSDPVVVDERIWHKHIPATCLRVTLPDKFGEVPDCGCPITGARYVVKVVAPNGREGLGIGVATTTERGARYTRDLHDLLTKAHTRAKNRAIADLIGVAENSAEEQRALSPVLSAEERKALHDAWVAANNQNREKALKQMVEWEFGKEGDKAAALFTNFNMRANEYDVAEILALLAGRTTQTFDPEEAVVEGEFTEDVAPTRESSPGGSVPRDETHQD